MRRPYREPSCQAIEGSHSVLLMFGANCGRRQRNRMDGHDMEPGDGLHQDQRGLRQLLCRAIFGTLSRRARASVRDGFDLTLRPERLLQPLEWKRPRMIFVNSMSDLFHKDIPKAHIAAVFDTMETADWHIYQVLTKRSSLLQKFINDRYRTRTAPAHMWFGVSVENEQATSRIAHLQKANAGVRFLSVEPLIAPVGKLDLAWHRLGDRRRRERPTARGRWTRNGQSTFATSASPRRWHSFSSNGAAVRPSPADACSKAGSGTSSRRQPRALPRQHELRAGA